QGDTAIRTAWQHVSEDVPPLSATVTWIPSEVDDLIAALTARNAKDRPVDAGAALQLVKAVIDCLSPELQGRRAERPASATSEQETERTPLGKGGTARLPVLPVASPQLPAAPIRPAHLDSPVDTSSALAPSDPEESLTVVETAPAPSTPKDPTGRSKKKRWIAAVITGVLVIAAALAGWYFTLGPGGRVAVPNVAGKTAVQAREVLVKAQFKVNTQREYSDTVAAGKATRTNPKAGQKAKKNSQVDLYISRGIEYVKVPDLAGKEGTEAGKLLKAAKLKIAESSEEYSDEVEKGKIIATAPEAGTSLRHHSGVKVIVSKGKEPITLPDFAGKSEEEVTKTLSDLKLKLEKTTEFSDSVPRGQIIGQEPAAGTTVYHGDQVKVRVSQGPEMVEVPNVTALNMGQAKKKLTDLGFQVQVQKQLLGIAPNRVYSQSPGGGTKLKRGSTVTLTYV
ncbi:Stk1 family PASTA domain-containing Ser/Thr kinase, partial [Varibaculum cambriense]